MLDLSRHLFWQFVGKDADIVANHSDIPCGVLLELVSDILSGLPSAIVSREAFDIFYLASLLAYLLANLLTFYLTYLLTFYLAYLLTFYLAYLLAVWFALLI